MARVKVRNGMPTVALTKAEFTRRAKIPAAVWDGVMIVTPVNWYQAPSRLKGTIDRVVCAEAAAPQPACDARLREVRP